MPPNPRALGITSSRRATVAYGGAHARSLPRQALETDAAPPRHRRRAVVRPAARRRRLRLAGRRGAPRLHDRPSAAATDEPIFASDEEALAAAVEAYEAYSEMSWQIAAEGGADGKRIRSLVSDTLAEQFEAEFATLAEAGIRSTGTPRVFGGRLADRRVSGDGELVQAYVCQDVTSVRLLDSSGKDVTPADREPVSAVLTRFSASGETGLILEDVEKWDDDSFCDAR